MRKLFPCHDIVIKWKHFPHYWPFVRVIHRSPVNYPQKGQWRGALVFSLIRAWINDCVNNREAGDLRRHCDHYDVTVIPCSHHLSLFPGANPNRRDHGRSLCADEWARFCGRYTCSEAIAKYVHSKKYMIKKTFFLSREKWSSEPDLLSRKNKKEAEKPKGNWISRHLSFKRKKSGHRTEAPSINEMKESVRSSSTPLLYTTDCSSPPDSPAVPRRPSCIDGVVATNIFPKLKSDGSGLMATYEDEVAQQGPPPQILETDFDDDRPSDDLEDQSTTSRDQTTEVTSVAGKCPRADNGWIMTMI